MVRRPLRITIGLSAVLLSAFGLPSERAFAGPAHYDKDTKSFRIPYTFADLPGGVGSVVGRSASPRPTRRPRSRIWSDRSATSSLK